MPIPYVTSVTFNQEKKIVLTVKIDETFTTGEPLEISGHATQDGGAFAIFNEIQAVPKRNPDKTAYIYVTATPSQPFVKGQAITVVLRTATVWATVLEQGEEEPSIGGGLKASGTALAEEGMSWGKISSVAYPAPPSMGNDGHAPTGSEASFPD